MSQQHLQHFENKNDNIFTAHQRRTGYLGQVALKFVFVIGVVSFSPADQHKFLIIIRVGILKNRRCNSIDPDSIVRFMAPQLGLVILLR